ncbi:MAG: histidine kinase, partial [Acidobacteria bacterium]|nr:histidine kinase [Acidobacteriota bacterium]
MAVGVYVTYGLYEGFGDLFRQAAAQPELRPLLTLGEGSASYATWSALTLLSMFAILFLPRQFQMMVVENVDETHLDKATWLFPLYLLVINIFVLPIALAGLMRFPGGSVNADTFVLSLPLAEGFDAMALLVFIGGLSAATAMVIVATVALSTMVSNDLLLPVLLRLKALPLTSRTGRPDLSGWLLNIRRVAIVVILALSYGYLRLTRDSLSLVSIGLI